MGRVLGLDLWKQGAFWEKKTCYRLNVKWKTFNIQYYVPQCHSCLTTLYFPVYCTSADLRNPENLASDLVDWSCCPHCSHSLRAILWYGPLLKVLWAFPLVGSAFLKHLMLLRNAETSQIFEFIQHQVIQEQAGSLPASLEHRWSRCFLPMNFLSWGAQSPINLEACSALVRTPKMWVIPLYGTSSRTEGSIHMIRVYEVCVQIHWQIQYKSLKWNNIDTDLSRDVHTLGTSNPITDGFRLIFSGCSLLIWKSFNAMSYR